MFHLDATFQQKKQKMRSWLILRLHVPAWAFRNFESTQQKWKASWAKTSHLIHTFDFQNVLSIVLRPWVVTLAECLASKPTPLKTAAGPQVGDVLCRFCLPKRCLVTWDGAQTRITKKNCLFKITGADWAKKNKSLMFEQNGINVCLMTF